MEGIIIPDIFRKGRLIRVIRNIILPLFGLGKIPKKVRSLLESERIVASAERIKGWCVTKDYKEPGKRFISRKEDFLGWMAVTEKRVLLYTFRKRQINIGTDDPKISSLHARLASPDILHISFEASDFHVDRRGVVRFILVTEHAKLLHNALIAAGVSEEECK